MEYVTGHAVNCGCTQLVFGIDRLKARPWGFCPKNQTPIPTVFRQLDVVEYTEEIEVGRD